MQPSGQQETEEGKSRSWMARWQTSFSPAIQMFPNENHKTCVKVFSKLLISAFNTELDLDYLDVKAGLVSKVL